MTELEKIKSLEYYFPEIFADVEEREFGVMFFSTTNPDSNDSNHADELVLIDYLYSCIVPEQYKTELTDFVTLELSNRIHYLAQNGLGIMDWSEKVYNFVEGLEIR